MWIELFFSELARLLSYLAKLGQKRTVRPSNFGELSTALTKKLQKIKIYQIDIIL